MTRQARWQLGLVVVAACGGDAAPAVDAGGSASCTVTASITASPSAKTATGLGAVTCTQRATLEVETCVQWNPSGSFVDVQCMSSTTSGTTAQRDNLASCGLTAGRQFRARVNVTVDGAAQPEALSTEVTCF